MRREGACHFHACRSISVPIQMFIDVSVGLRGTLEAAEMKLLVRALRTDSDAATDKGRRAAALDGIICFMMSYADEPWLQRAPLHVGC